MPLDALIRRLQRSSIVDALWQMVPMLIVDMHSGEILDATQPVEQLFGYAMLGELIGKSVDTLVPESIRPRHSTHREGYAQSPHSRPMGTADMQLTGQRRDGSTFPVQIALHAAVIEGKHCVIAIVAEGHA